MSTSKDDNASIVSEETSEMKALKIKISQMNGQNSQLLGIFSDIKELKQEKKRKDEKNRTTVETD